MRVRVSENSDLSISDFLPSSVGLGLTDTRRLPEGQVLGAINVNTHAQIRTQSCSFYARLRCRQISTIKQEKFDPPAARLRLRLRLKDAHREEVRATKLSPAQTGNKLSTTMRNLGPRFLVTTEGE